MSRWFYGAVLVGLLRVSISRAESYYPRCMDAEGWLSATTCEDGSGNVVLKLLRPGSEKTYNFSGTFSMASGGEGTFSDGKLRVRKALGSQAVFPGLLELKTGEKIEVQCSLITLFSCGEGPPIAFESSLR